MAATEYLAQMQDREDEMFDKYGESYYQGMNGIIPSALKGPPPDAAAPPDGGAPATGLLVPSAAQDPQPPAAGFGELFGENEAYKSLMEQIDRGTRGLAGAGERRDAVQKQRLLEYIDNAFEMNRKDPGVGMSLAMAEQALIEAADTNRLQYVTTNTAGGAGLAESLGMGSRTPEGTAYGRSTGGDPFTVMDRFNPQQSLSDWLDMQKSGAYTRQAEAYAARAEQGNAAQPPAGLEVKKHPAGWMVGGDLYTRDRWEVGEDGRLYPRGTNSGFDKDGNPVRAPGNIPSRTRLAAQLGLDGKQPAAVRPSFNPVSGAAQMLNLSPARTAPAAQAPRIPEVSAEQLQRFTPQQQAAYNWAQQNPDNPKAAAVLSKLGL